MPPVYHERPARQASCPARARRKWGSAPLDISPGTVHDANSGAGPRRRKSRAFRTRVARLACPTVSSHCWTSQQWHQAETTAFPTRQHFEVHSMTRQAIFEASVQYFLEPLAPLLDDESITEIMVNGYRRRLRRAARQAGTHRRPLPQRRRPALGDPQRRAMGGPGDQRGTSGAGRPAAQRLPRPRHHSAQRRTGHLSDDPQVLPRSAHLGRLDRASAACRRRPRNFWKSASACRRTC